MGVARQYCGQLGMQDNCQVAVSISLATEQASLPMAYRLYLPKEWADDPARQRTAGVPAKIGFATETAIAVEQLDALLARGYPKHCALADADCGVDTAFRQWLADRGLEYVARITSAIVVLTAWRGAIAAEALHGDGQPVGAAASHPYATTDEREGAGDELAAHYLPDDQLREGTNATLNGRFAAVRVRHASGNAGLARLRPQEWLRSSGLRMKPSLPSTTSRRFRPISFSTIWWPPRTAVDVSSATTRA